MIFIRLGLTSCSYYKKLEGSIIIMIILEDSPADSESKKNGHRDGSSFKQQRPPGGRGRRGNLNLYSGWNLSNLSGRLGRESLSQRSTVASVWDSDRPYPNQ